MGVNRRRRKRKNGKKVGNGSAKINREIEQRRKERDANLLSLAVENGITLQDLINVVALQEQEKNKFRPCGGANANVCVAEGCFNGEDCLDALEVDALPLEPSETETKES